MSEKLKTEKVTEDDFRNNKVKKILDSYLLEKKYQYTNSKSYKIKHNEVSRLINVAKYTAKNDGIYTLMRAVKRKIKQKALKK